MANNHGDKPPQRPVHEQELLPAIMAIALAVVAQLALQDGLILLGVAGYVVAIWLFVASVHGHLESRPAAVDTAPPETLTTTAPSDQLAIGAGRLAYLRRHWRLVTLAEIFQGDIPPARLIDQATSAPAPEAPREADAIPARPQEEAPPARRARLESWVTSDSLASTPSAVKVTPQGDVLVLDTGLEQVQRFDDAGNLLATYSLAGLAGLSVADLAVSPDGRTLYVVDAASNRLQVITLNDEPSGEEE